MDILAVRRLYHKNIPKLISRRICNFSSSSSRDFYKLDFFNKSIANIQLIRSLQILTNIANELLQEFQVLVLGEKSALCSLVLIASILIRFSHKLPILFTVSFLMAIAFVVVYLVLSYEIFGAYNEVSRKHINCLKLTNKGRKLGVKYLNSCQELNIKMGSFGFYNKKKKIQIIAKMIFYTSKFLIITK